MFRDTKLTARTLEPLTNLHRYQGYISHCHSVVQFEANSVVRLNWFIESLAHMFIVLTQVISRTQQPTNVHQLAILLASMLTAHHPTFAHVTLDTVRPLTTATQLAFLSVKMGASMDSALLLESAPAILATPKTLTTALGTHVFQYVLGVVPMVTAPVPMSALATLATLKIPQ
jgi:hypothetical protein